VLSKSVGDSTVLSKTVGEFRCIASSGSIRLRILCLVELNIILEAAANGESMCCYFLICANVGNIMQRLRSG